MRVFSLSSLVDAHPSPLPSASASGLVTNRLGWGWGAQLVPCVVPAAGWDPVPSLFLLWH